MKNTIFFLFLVIAAVLYPGLSQSQQKGSALQGILTEYYDIKNALVSSDAAGASKSAGELIRLTNSIEVNSLAASEQALFKSLQTKLVNDASKIAGSKDINAQRVSFQTLSQNMITLVKGAKLSSSPVYIDYCPMKKASWLSAEQVIKNPYYGNAMLSCGNVSETLK
jgi:hypothetical protein